VRPRQAKIVQAQQIGVGVVTDRGHDQGFAIEQLEVVGDVAGAATELAPHLGNQERDIEDVNLLGQDVVLETIMEDHDVIEGD